MERVFGVTVSMPLTLPLPAISSRLPQLTLLYSAPSRTYPTTLLSFLNHLSLIGLLTMDIYIIKDACMCHLPLDPLCSTLFTLTPFLVTSDVSGPRPLSNTTSGGPDFPYSSITSLLAAPFVNRTKPLHTL